MKEINKCPICGELLDLSNVKQHSIAVISLNVQYFQRWKNDTNLNSDLINTRRKFKVNNTTYHCITKVSDLHSLNLDEIIQTKFAIENKDYENLKLLAQANLKTFDINKYGKR